ncbi:MAG: IclR family transcriptional regulator, partial [Verrucomicrobiota bacterium]
MVRRDKSNYIIQSVAHALDVLEEFRGETDELGVTELSKKLKLHKNNVFRILATLQSRNYIEQNKSNDNYRLGVKCLELGQTFIHQRGLLKQAKGILHELAASTGETCYISFLRGNEVVYLDAVEGTSTVRVVSRVGLHMPLYATAAGKALVAFESDEELARRFPSESRRFTKNTKTTLEELKKDLEGVRQNGYA